MNESLEQVLRDYYKTIRAERANYRACYNSFLEYCNTRLRFYSLADLAENLTKIDIEQACKYYFEESKKATSIEAVQRFLTAIDQFCKYTREREIKWRYLENGCRNKQIVHDICVSLNNGLKQKIYLPFDGEEVRNVEEQIAHLNKENFFQFGQSVIYSILIKYGFKEKVIINLKTRDFNEMESKLLLDNDEGPEISIKLDEDISLGLEKYCKIHKYPKREYLFTKSNGLQLTPDSIFATLKEKVKKANISNFTPTTVALNGVANLIEKGLTLQEIKILTGFETQKIEDVSKYLLTDEDTERVINEKLQNKYNK